MMSRVNEPRDATATSLNAFLALALPLTLGKAALHLALVERYGYHRDELYFIACGQHLAFGYVDHAPFVPFIARFVAGAFDYSLLGLRLPAITASSLTLFLTMLLSRDLGGGRSAQLLAGLCVLIAPVFLRTAKILHIPVFEPVFWLGATLVVTRLLRGGDRRLWLAVGAICGIGLLNKHTMALFGLGLAVGLMLTPSARRHLAQPWLWAGLALSAVILAPNVLWQVGNDFATLEFLARIKEGMLARIPRVLFLAGQILYMHPLTLPVWVAGLWFLGATRAGAIYRPLVWLYPTALLVLLWTGAKPYYLAPIYPMLFAAGGVQLEHVFRERLAVLRVGMATMVVGGATLAFATVPVVSLPNVDAGVERLLGWAVPAMALTHDLHDEYGWAEQAAAVARVHRTLSEAEQAAAVIVTGNYGEASAIGFFGPRHGLPQAVTGHMSYYVWGPPRTHGTLIVYGVNQAQLDQLCETRVERGRTHHPLAVPKENDLPIYVCKPRVSLRELWPRLKRFGNDPTSGG